MRRLLSIIVTLLFATLLTAQVPQGFTYQAVVRNSDGSLVANRMVAVRIGLMQGNGYSNERYSETHMPMTDAMGMFTITIGNGTPTTSCSIRECVDWAHGPWFLSTQIDPEGGNNFTLSTTQQLMSVPFALYADRVGACDTVYVRVHDSAIYIHDSIVVRIRDSVVYDTIDSYAYDRHPSDIDGALPGVFSISPVNRIAFSKGNLQYNAYTSVWRFAEHQYDVVGTANSNISSTYNGWIDLFGFGTSGYDSKYPYLSETNSTMYATTDIINTNYDWGVRNAISNGGDSVNMWRTLTLSEWRYVINTRSNASRLKTFATIAGVAGLILLPDNWGAVDSIAMIFTTASFSRNIYSAQQWNVLQDNGAVFLPCSGYRYAQSVYSVGSYGRYWTADRYGSYNGIGMNYAFYFDVTTGTKLAANLSDVTPSYAYSYEGFSVRLVTDLTVMP